MCNLASVSVWMRHCQLYGVRHLFSVNGCSWWYTNQNPVDVWWICLFHFCLRMHSQLCVHAYTTCLADYITIWKVWNFACKCHKCSTLMWCFIPRLRQWIRLWMWLHWFDLKTQSIKAAVCFNTNCIARFWHFPKPWQSLHLFSFGSQHCWEAIIMIVFSVIFLPITSHF